MTKTMIEILDLIISQAQEQGWIINYIALSLEHMQNLSQEVTAFVGKDFKVSVISKYKEIDLKVKDIRGFQVSYEIEPLPF